MKYLPTPMNLTALFFLIIAIYSYLTSPKGGDGLQNFYVIPLIILAIALLAIDFGFQKWIDSYQKIAIIQGVLIGSLFLFTYFGLKPEKIPEFNIPDGFGQDYFAVFYDIKNAPELFAQDDQQNVPTNGIILVSNDHNEPRWAATMNGKLKNGEPISGMSTFSGVLICNSEEFHYQIYYLEEYDYDKFEEIQEEINRELQRACGLLQK